MIIKKQNKKTINVIITQALNITLILTYNAAFSGIWVIIIGGTRCIGVHIPGKEVIDPGAIALTHRHSYPAM